MDRRDRAAKYTLGGGRSSSVPVSKNALKESQNAEFWLAKNLGATPDELKKIKLDNKAETGVTRTAMSGEGGIYDKITGYLDRADQYRSDYGLAGRTGSTDGHEAGFTTGLLAKGAFVMDGGKAPNPNVSHVADMLKFAGENDGKNLTADQIAKKGRLDTIKPVKGQDGTYRVRYGYDVGANDKASTSYYFKKNTDGTYTSTGFGFDKDNIKNSSGGFFGSGLGQIAMIGLSVWGGGVLANALTSSLGTMGANIASGAIIGGGSAALTGGDIGKGILLGGVGGAFSGATKGWAPTGNVVADGAIKGAIRGVGSAALSGGNPLSGAVGGAAGGAVGSGVGDAIGGKTGEIVGGVAGSMTNGTVQGAMAEDGTIDYTQTQTKKTAVPSWSSLFPDQQVSTGRNPFAR